MREWVNYLSFVVLGTEHDMAGQNGGRMLRCLDGRNEVELGSKEGGHTRLVKYIA